MKETTRAYFHQMYETSRAYGEAKHRREEEKRKLMEADDWEGVEAWHKREEQFPSPYTAGQMKAYWAYDRSSEIELDELMMDDSLWEREVKDFSDTLRAAGVTSFVITNQSTGLMEDIHNLTAQGWRLVGPCKVTYIHRRWGEDTQEARLGLRFEIEEEGKA